MLFGGQEDVLNFCGSISASLSLSHLPPRGIAGNRAYYPGVSPTSYEAIWGLCGRGGLAFFFQVLLSFSKIFYGNYFRERIMIIMMIILIMGLLCEIALKKIKKPPVSIIQSRRGWASNTWPGLWEQPRAVVSVCGA